MATAPEGVVRRPEPLVWGLLAFAWLLPLHAVTIAYLFGGLAWPAGLVRAVAAWKEALVVTLLACVLLIPMLTVLADFMGVIGGAFISTQHFGIEAHQYWSMSQQKINLWDIFVGLFKSCVFGGAIAIISCHKGFNSSGGAQGVGKSATVAFVRSFVAILILDFFLAMFFNSLHRQLWPRS